MWKELVQLQQILDTLHAQETFLNGKIVPLAVIGRDRTIWASPSLFIDHIQLLEDKSINSITPEKMTEVIIVCFLRHADKNA